MCVFGFRKPERAVHVCFLFAHIGMLGSRLGGGGLVALKWGGIGGGGGADCVGVGLSLASDSIMFWLKDRLLQKSSAPPPPPQDHRLRPLA